MRGQASSYPGSLDLPQLQVAPRHIPAAPRRLAQVRPGNSPRWERAAAVGAVTIVVAPIVVLLLAIYSRQAIELPRIWSIDPNYSHGFLVPLVALALAWRTWNSDKTLGDFDPTARDVAFGAGRIALGLLLHAVAWFIYHRLLDTLSLICVVRGLTLMLGGSRCFRAFGPATLFLIFMVPLPQAWMDTLAIALQQWASSISTLMLSWCNVPVFREGNLINLPGYTMEVGEACSGLRQIMSMVALSAALACYSGRSATFRWSLGLLSIPLAVAANSLRVLLTGFILMLFGPKWAEGAYHSLEGLAVVGLGAVLIVLTAWGLSKIDDLLRTHFNWTSAG